MFAFAPCFSCVPKKTTPKYCPQRFVNFGPPSILDVSLRSFDSRWHYKHILINIIIIIIVIVIIIHHYLLFVLYFWENIIVIIIIIVITLLNRLPTILEHQCNTNSCPACPRCGRNIQVPEIYRTYKCRIYRTCASNTDPSKYKKYISALQCTAILNFDFACISI